MASKEQVRKWQGHLALQAEKNLPTSLALNLYFAMPSIPSMADVLQLELSLRTVLPRTSRDGSNGVKLMLGEEGYLFTRLSDDKCLCPVALFNKLISAEADKKKDSKGSQGGGLASGKPLLHALTLSTLCDSLSDAIASTTPELGPLKEEQELLDLLERTRPNLAPPQPEEASPANGAAGGADEAVVGGGGGGGDSDNKKACRVCGQPGVLKCAGCGKARYCSRVCQKSDWKTHKKECKAKLKAKHDGEHSPLAV